jgi:DNA-binding YbaB/EbfC family protein|tara:strand:+ start:491 stop:808 length:318 start_codon:yes stop_codon:yes gene_type:complete
MTDIQQLMQMGQQLQARMAELQEELSVREISASAGGGMVTATVDGKGGVTRMVIDPTVVDARDVEMLEDLVLAAISEAQGKAQGQYEEDMRKAAGGMPIQIPGLF